MGFSCLKATEAIREDSLLIAQCPGICSTHLISPGRMKKSELTLEPPSGFEHGTPGLEIQHPNHYDNWEDVC